MNLRHLTLLPIAACAAFGTITVNAQQKPKTWEPNPALLTKLDKEVSLIGFRFRPPAGYDAVTPDKLPEGVVYVTWIGPQRADKTRPTLMVNMLIPPAAERDNTTLEHFADSVVKSLKGPRTNFTTTPIEKGEINGIICLHATWSGIQKEENRRIQGGFYAFKDRDIFVGLAYQDVPPGAEQNLALMDSSLRTFRKLSQRIYFSIQWPDHSQIWSMKPDGSDRVCLTPKSDTDYNPVISLDGSTIAFTTHRSGVRSIWLMNLDGSNQRPLTEKLDAGLCAWSPDGAMLAFSSNRDGKYCIYTMRKDGTDIKKITDGPSDDCPCWTQGQTIVYEGVQNGIWRIMSVKSDGSGAKALTDGLAHARWPNASQDGFSIIYTTYIGKTGDRCHLSIMKSDGSMQTPLSVGPQNDRQPCFTADGGQILFHSDKTGQYEIYVMESDKLVPRRLTTDLKETQQVTTAGRMYVP